MRSFSKFAFAALLVAIAAPPSLKEPELLRLLSSNLGHGRPPLAPRPAPFI